MILHRLLPAVLLLAAGASPNPAGPSPTSARGELDDLRTTLDKALGPAAGVAFLPMMRSAGGAYRLPGYGALIVLAPRALSGPGRPVRGVVAFPGRHAVPDADTDTDTVTFQWPPLDLAALERDMETQMAAQAAALRQMEAAQRDWTGSGAQELRQHLQLVEKEAEVFRVEAERARRQAERAVRTRLAPPPPPVPVAAIAPAAPTPPAPPEFDAAEPEPPPVPETPEAPEAPEAPDAPPPPPPPWVFWFDVPAPPPPSHPADVETAIADVRASLTQALASYRRPLRALRPDDVLTVAVDFVGDHLPRTPGSPRTPGTPRTPPARTLLVRVRVRDLQARQAGRLSADELRQRLDFDEED
jgi:hypothetical protein